MASKKKIMLTGASAREQVLGGVDYLAEAVKLTMGPKGRNFASGIRGGFVTISNDGVSLAKEIQGRNEFEDIGVRAVREAATKTNEKAGDGTTSAVVLTQAILKLPALEFDKDIIGHTSDDVVKKIESETEFVIKELEKIAKPIKDKKHLIQVAKVSVEDDALADLIGGAQWDVTASGTVLAEEYNEVKDRVEFIHGVRIDNGLGTSAIANNQQKGALELKDIQIIVTDKIFNKAQDIKDLNGVFKSLIDTGSTGIVLVGRAFDETALALCVKNIALYFEGKGGYPIYPINAPYVDHGEIMEDLAAATGAKFVKSTERNLMQITTRDVGMATKIFCTRYEGIITGLKRGDDERVDEMVDARVEEIKEKLKGEISAFEKRGLESRLAQLTVGTAIIKVGAETEQERKYKKDKVDDAVNAVKAAMQEGIVPGAGQALKQIADENPNLIIADALRAPYKQIMANAGGEFEVPAWVHDPLKVVRTAFEKASSIARSLATTEIVVTYEDESKYRELKTVVNSASEDE